MIVILYQIVHFATADGGFLPNIVVLIPCIVLQVATWCVKSGNGNPVSGGILDSAVECQII